jgi:hypothetical protein
VALTTLLDYKTAVMSAGYDRVTDDDALLDAINEARQSVKEERRWSWSGVFGNTTLTLTYDTPSVALNGIADLAYVDAVRIEFGTTYLTIDYASPQKLRDLEHNDRAPGEPQYWTEAAGQLRFWPSPDKAYSVSVDYVRTMTDLAVDTDIDSDIPPAFKALVKWKAVEALCFRTRDFQGSQIAEGKYLAELRRKINGEAVTQRQTAQQVRSSPHRFR